MCVQIFHMVNIDVPAGVGAPPLDTTQFLKLNVGKCEVIVFSYDRSATSVECSVGGELVLVGGTGEHLGYCWRGDLLSSRAVQENIKRARGVSSCLAVLVSIRVLCLHGQL